MKFMDVWELIERLLASGEVRSIFIDGPPGTGKTYAAYHYGRISSGVHAVTLTEDTPAAELRGHWIPRGGEMVWHNGPLVESQLQGSRLVLNELTHSNEDARSLLYPILESPETARMTLPNNITVRPTAGFHIVATDNLGAEALPEALRDRFDCVVHVDKPHPKAMERIPEQYRQAAEKTVMMDSGRKIGLRAWLSIAKLVPALGEREAFRAVLGEDRGAALLEALALSKVKGAE